MKLDVIVPRATTRWHNYIPGGLFQPVIGELVMWSVFNSGEDKKVRIPNKNTYWARIIPLAHKEGGDK